MNTMVRRDTHQQFLAEQRELMDSLLEKAEAGSQSHFEQVCETWDTWRGYRRSELIAEYGDRVARLKEFYS